MSGDRRGFHYALEPLQRLTQWQLDEKARDLSEQNARVEAAQQHLDRLQADIEATRRELLRRMEPPALLDLDVQRRTFAYLCQLQNPAQTARDDLRTATATRDETLAQLIELRQRSEGLEKHREAEAAVYDQHQARQINLAADESWLQRRHWSNAS